MSTSMTVYSGMQLVARTWRLHRQSARVHAGGALVAMRRFTAQG